MELLIKVYNVTLRKFETTQIKSDNLSFIKDSLSKFDNIVDITIESNISFTSSYGLDDFNSLFDGVKISSESEVTKPYDITKLWEVSPETVERMKEHFEKDSTK